MEEIKTAINTMDYVAKLEFLQHLKILFSKIKEQMGHEYDHADLTARLRMTRRLKIINDLHWLAASRSTSLRKDHYSSDEEFLKRLSLELEAYFDCLN